MAAIFQIRRGTTNASLTEGELYLHQGSGSLQFGSGSNSYNTLTLDAPVKGDINLIGNISASGDIRIGGNIYLGDNIANDSVNVNSAFSGSIIPSGSNVFDLGSTTLQYRNIHATSISGAIAATNGVISGSSQVVGILSSLNTYTGSQDTKNTTLGAYTASLDTKNTTLATYTGSVNSQLSNLNTATSSYETKGRGIVSGSSQITYASISSIPSGIVSGSSQVTPLLPTGVISGSSQLSGTTITDLTIVNLTTVNETASVIFSSGSNRFGDFGDDTHSFTGSVKISGSITTIGSSTATSYNGTINATNGVVSGSSQITPLLPTGVVSGSSQITYASISSIPSGIVSGSSQVLGGTGIVSGSSQITYTNISSIPAGIVSGSTQITTLLPTGTVSGSVQVLGGTGIVSGSSQITYANISSIPAGILSGSAQVTPLLPAGVVSGSAQTIINLPTGVVSGSSQITTLGFVSSSVTASSLVTASVNVNVLTFTKGNGSTFDLTVVASGTAPAGTISGSAQITTLGFISSSSVPAGTISGSSQLGNFVATIAGTSNQVLVAGSGVNNAAITLTTPQDIATTSNVTFNNITASAGIRAVGDIIAYYSSDERLKENITPIENALSKVESISGNTYDWKEGFDNIHPHKGNDVGVIAQEIEKVLPQVVVNRENGYKAVDYEKIIPLLIESIKELSAKVKELENK